jgi:Leucine-rich repeat (LRR) protein
MEAGEPKRPPKELSSMRQTKISEWLRKRPADGNGDGNAEGRKAKQKQRNVIRVLNRYDVDQDDYHALQAIWDEGHILRDCIQFGWIRLDENKRITYAEIGANSTRLGDLDALKELVVKTEVLSPKVGMLYRLQKLSLSESRDIIELPHAIGKLHQLKELNLQYCSRLVSLPLSIGNLRNLKDLNLKWCGSLETLLQRLAIYSHCNP